VKDSLVSKGYTVETLNTFDEDLLNNIKIICYIFSIVSIFVALIVIVLYFRKKLENDLYDLAILRFSGLNNKLTKKCLFLENTIILSFSFIFSIVIFLIIKFMIVQKYNNYFTIYNIQFLFNRNILCIVFILIVVIPLSLLTLISNKKLNSNIDVLLRKGGL
jgi:ABC-type antimicrobial peptide transport system permease subunit